MRDINEAREFFKKDIFATETTGIKIEDTHKDYSKCSLKIENKHLAANNQIMGGAIFTLADFAFAVAANEIDNFTVTSTSNISYISMAKDNNLIAECKAIKNGRKVAFYETEIRDGLGNLIAIVTSSGIHLS